jgi:hypothetical protein
MNGKIGMGALIALLSTSIAPAMAGTISKTVAAGRASNVDHYTGWNNDCSFMLIKIDVTTKPAHGSVSTRITSGRISGHADIGSAGSCAGKPTKVLQLYYKPAPGYRGSDSFTVNMTSGSGFGAKTQTYYYQMTVQ